MRSTLIYIILSKCEHNMLNSEIQKQDVEDSFFLLSSVITYSLLKILATTDSGQKY